MKINVICDSSSEISQAKAKELGVEVLPIEISFGEESYLDGVTINNTEFYDKLVNGNVVPKTSLVNSARWLEAFKKYKEKDEYIFVLPLDSALSGTYQAACIAKDELDYDKIYVCDPLTASAGIYILVLEVLKKAKETDKFQEVIDYIEGIKDRVKIYCTLDSLEYLYKGGRISKAIYLAGSLMQLKPVIKVEKDGTLAVTTKGHGTKKAMLAQLKKIDNHSLDKKHPVFVGYSSRTERADEFVRMSKGKFDKYPYVQVGPTIGTHVGPSIAAVFYVRTERKEDKKKSK